MARIPTHDSEAQITTEVGRAEVDPSKMAGLGKMIETTGEGLAGLGKQFKKLKDHQQQMAASDLASSDLDKASLEAHRNPDIYGAMEKYDEQAHEIINSRSEMINSMEAREAWQSKMMTQMEHKRSNLQAQIYQKQSNLYQGTFETHIDNLVKDHLDTHPKDADAVRIEGEMKQELDTAINIMGVNPTRARAAKEK